MTARDKTSATTTRGLQVGGEPATGLGTVDKQGQVLTADAGVRAVRELHNFVPQRSSEVWAVQSVHEVAIMTISCNCLGGGSCSEDDECNKTVRGVSIRN